MCSLDASALTQDVEGLSFLKAVLGTSEGATGLPGAFDPEAARPSWTVSPSEEDLARRLQATSRFTESV